MTLNRENEEQLLLSLVGFQEIIMANPNYVFIEDFVQPGENLKVDGTNVWRRTISAIAELGGGTVFGLSGPYRNSDYIAVHHNVTVQGPIGSPGSALPGSDAGQQHNSAGAFITPGTAVSLESDGTFAGFYIIQEMLADAMPLTTNDAAQVNRPGFAGGSNF